MENWQKGAIVGGIWGIFSILVYRKYYNPLCGLFAPEPECDLRNEIIKIIALPATIASKLYQGDDYIVGSSLAIGSGITIGTTIGTGTGYLIDKYKNR